jgi:hypothetical protein
MAARPRTNTSSRRRGPEYYYDATTEKLVGDREKLIVEKFGYRAPSERADVFADRAGENGVRRTGNSKGDGGN